ncbi:MAG: aldo/keto reductase [Candidatus Zhuqueibacterota bacterium]
MEQNFTHTILGKTGLAVHRLGISGTYWPGQATLHKALDAGLNYFFFFNIDKQMIRFLRTEMKGNREKFVIATGAYNLLVGHPNIERTLEKRLRQIDTDYIDIFMFLGVMKEKQFPVALREQMYRLKESDKIRHIGISTHDRKFAGRLAAEGALDVIMMRYNAAHRGAEQDIFPHLKVHNPGVVSFTATRWRYLLRRPKNWPGDERIPTPGMCYRFVLSNPNVHVCMTAPSNPAQIDENLAALSQGPLSEEDIRFMQRFGDAVHHTKTWFM